MQSTLDPRIRILRYVLTYRSRLLIACVAGLLMAGCNPLIAKMIKWFTAALDKSDVTQMWVIQQGLAQGWIRPGNEKLALLWIVAVSVALLHIPKALFGYVNAYLITSVTNRIGNDVRNSMYAHLQTLPLSFFHSSKIGHIISRMSYDVGLIQNSGNLVTQAIDGPLTIITGLIGMFLVSWKLAVLTIIFAPMMGLAIDRLTKRIRSLTSATQIKLADVNAYIEESVRGVRIVRAFGTENEEIKRFGRANENSLVAALRAAQRSCVVLPAIELMGGVAAALIILLGGLMVVKGEIPFAGLNEFTFLAFIVTNAGKQFGRLNVAYQQTMAGAERIFELLDTRSDLVEKPDAVVLRRIKGRVEFREVDFQYKCDEPVLEKVSFTIEPGEAVAIVGPSGAGKSTIADLIPRFYDVTGGAILIDGHDVRDVRMDSLREHIAMVPQETILFSGTIADNIAYGRPGAGRDEIIGVAKAANADEFVSRLPNGYETVLGEGGVGLSGGQRQRISIARALLKDPRILILDEATSSLDAASEGVVQEALDRLMKGRSTLVIAHRLSTVTSANRILVMDKARIVEDGTFDELVGSHGLFAQLYKTQYRPEDNGL